jgi:predicted GNAT superfamily acetyltransferase
VKAEADFVWRRGRFLEFGYIRRGLGKQRSRGSGNEKRRRNYLRKLASAFS